MIDALFLSCALALPMGFAQHDQQPKKPMSQILDLGRDAFTKYPRTHDRLGIEASVTIAENHLKGIFLTVGGDPYHVKIMRDYGIKVFGAYTEDYTPITRWHAVAQTGRLPFREELFRGIFWHHIFADPGMLMEWIVDVTALVEPGGFFLFDPEKYRHWEDYLFGQGWHKMPRHWSWQLSVWQKPDFRIPLPSWRHAKKLIQFPVKLPKWKMFGGPNDEQTEQRALQSSA